MPQSQTTVPAYLPRHRVARVGWALLATHTVALAIGVIAGWLIAR